MCCYDCYRSLAGFPYRIVLEVVVVVIYGAKVDDLRFLIYDGEFLGFLRRHRFALLLTFVIPQMSANYDLYGVVIVVDVDK